MIIVAIFFSIAILSCEKEAKVQEIILDSDIELTVIIDNETKTSLSGTESECTVVWNSHDALAVVNNGKLYRFVISDSCANSSVGKFKMDMSALPANYKVGDFNQELPVQVFYPYEGFAYDTLTRTMTYDVPYKQKNIIYKASEEETGNVSFDKGAMPMAGYVDNFKKDIIFKKLLAGVKFTLLGKEDEKVNSIDIVSNYHLNGKASVTISEGIGNVPLLLLDIHKNQLEKNSERDYDKISVDCTNDGISIASPVEFVVVLPENAKNLGIILKTNYASYYHAISPSDTTENAGNILKNGKIHIVPDIKTADKIPAYIEDGIYLGEGIKLPKNADKSEYILWAPVNCGFKADEKIGGQTIDRGYLFGKLYQWGRKDGHGYKDVAYEDSSYPNEVSILGNGTPQAEKFYQDWKVEGNHWPQDSDPCPDGWRVPTIEELISLLKGLNMNDYIIGLGSQWTSSFNDSSNQHFGQPGFIFYGNSTSTNNKIFLPAAGFYRYNMEENMIRGLSGCYWSSTSPEPGKAWYLDFNRKGYIDSYYDTQSSGRSVRCVKN